MTYFLLGYLAGVICTAFVLALTMASKSGEWN